MALIIFREIVSAFFCVKTGFFVRKEDMKEQENIQKGGGFLISNY